MTFHMNESSVANILSFVEVAYIAGVHINMDTSKEKVINIHMQYKHIIHFIACAEGLFYTNLDDPSMVTNTINTSVKPYYFLSIVKQNSGFSLILKLKERDKFKNFINIYTGQEHQSLKHIYDKEWYVTSHLPPKIKSELTTYMSHIEL